jgi:TetR/AcrR family transcriptional regulator
MRAYFLLLLSLLTIWLIFMAKAAKDHNTEKKILEAARKIFLANGMAGARMQDIADEAGINKALLHYYFRSKDKLFEMIFKEAMAGFVPWANTVFESDLPLFQKIEQFTSEYIDLLIKNPYIPLFVLNEINRQPEIFIKKMWGGNRPSPGAMMQQIEVAIRKGLIRPIAPIHLVINMISMCIFPFVGRPMIQLVMKLNDSQFRQLMEQRKTEIASFIILSIRK